MLGERVRANELLAALGFNDASDAGFDAWWVQLDKLGIKKMGTFPRDTWRALVKLLVLLCAGHVSAGTGLALQVPSPDELCELNKAWFTQTLGIASLLNLGARAYERLGDDDKAAATALLGVSEEHNKKKAVRADCYLVLGRVAARRAEPRGTLRLQSPRRRPRDSRCSSS